MYLLTYRCSTTSSRWRLEIMLLQLMFHCNVKGNTATISDFTVFKTSKLNSSFKITKSQNWQLVLPITVFGLITGRLPCYHFHSVMQHFLQSRVVLQGHLQNTCIGIDCFSYCVVLLNIRILVVWLYVYKCVQSYFLLEFFF